MGRTPATRRHAAGVAAILTAIIVTSALVVVIGVPFTLWWWRIADQWADAEHRRFKAPVDDRERVIVSVIVSGASDEVGDGGSDGRGDREDEPRPAAGSAT